MHPYHADALREPQQGRLRQVRPYGCLHKFNGLARYHNNLLRREVRALRAKHPGTKIAYADYARPVVGFLKNPANFGEIDRSIVTFACIASR